MYLLVLRELGFVKGSDLGTEVVLLKEPVN